MKEKKVLLYKCPICNKEISSLSRAQFDYNKDQHMQMHIREAREDEARSGLL